MMKNNNTILRMNLRLNEVCELALNIKKHLAVKTETSEDNKIYN